MLTFEKYFLRFKRPAGTSRGTLHEKETYILRWRDEDTGRVAWGESNLFKGLSFDDRPNYEKKLADVCRKIDSGRSINPGELREWPSILMGVETLLLDRQNGSRRLIFDTPFARGKGSIPINGLIWMGQKDEMISRVKAKLQDGFTCIKLKIGAIDFDSELEILRFIRQQFTPQEIEIRVDANGAFSPLDALEKLKRLSEFKLHSIEQPIKPGQWNEMAVLARESPVPVALDEELIGVVDHQKKRDMLELIRPPYIILKPALAGGFAGCDEWIELIEEQGGNWWITSALESNIGLNAIAQYAAFTENSLPQGLGTGQLYLNNFDSPLEIKNGHLQINPHKEWNLSSLS